MFEKMVKKQRSTGVEFYTANIDRARRILSRVIKVRFNCKNTTVAGDPADFWSEWSTGCGP
jgi:hypothetical protein